MTTLQRLGEFEIVRFLGRGGMGAVFEARQPSLDRSVALKMLPDWFAGDEAALKRFRHEAAVAAQLDHPHIVPVYAIGSDDGRHFYTMKLIRGLSLADLIKYGPDETATEGAGPTRPSPTVTVPDDGTEETDPEPSGNSFRIAQRIPYSEVSAGLLDRYRRDRYRVAARMGAQVAKALAHAHDRGHIHRDIKPSNIMVDADGQFYVIDFGITRALEETHTATFCGTLKYMSPEQVAHESPDGKTDVYSLGVTMYELLAQVSPFGSGKESEVAQRIREGDALPLREYVPDVPPALEDCIRRAMQVDRARRPSAAELAEELARASDSGAPAVPVPNTAWRTGALLAILVLLLATGGVGLYFATRPPPPSKPHEPDSPPAMDPWGVDVWNGWFREPPKTLFNSQGGPVKHDPGKRTVTADTKRGTIVLTRGTIEAADYTIELDVTALPEGGDFFEAGIFFGGRDLVGQAVTVRVNPVSKRIDVVRTKLNLNNGAGTVSRTIIRTAKLKSPQPDSFRLKIRVTPSGLASVECVTKDGTQTFAQLVEPRYNQRVENRYYRGLFGVVVLSGAAEFSRGRHMVNGKRE